MRQNGRRRLAGRSRAANDLDADRARRLDGRGGRAPEAIA